MNDVSAGVFDPLMVPTVGSLGVPYIAMHMRGDPQTMTQPQNLDYRPILVKDRPTLDQSVKTAYAAPFGEALNVDANHCEHSETSITAEDNAVVTIVAQELLQRLAEVDSHLPRWLQWVDPGIGFAKGYEENLALLQPRNLRRFKKLLGDRFMVVGFSRKKFLSRIVEESLVQRRQVNYEIDTEVPASARSVVGGTLPAVSAVSLEERDLASAAGCTALLQGQADVVRVHNVAPTRIVCDTFQAFHNFK